MIAIVTDSNSQIPPELASRLGISVVPLTVTVDGVAYQEGVDLDADEFYARFASGAPAVATSQPSPGTFAATFRSLADEGADAIVSVHIGSSLSGTVNSARLAAATSTVPVRIVDTGTASFGVAFAAWEAADVAAAGGTMDEVVAAAERVGATVGNVFVVGAPALARAGGRLTEDAPPDPPSATATAVVTLAGGALQTVGHASDLEQAARIMADHVLASGPWLRVAVGVADAGTLPLVAAVEALLRNAPEVKELIRYRVGPSVGAHTGPGTMGMMFYPSPPSTLGSDHP
jgi:DegV family protein with EDD domain